MSNEIVIGKEGRVANYRRARRHIKPKFCILQFSGIETRQDAGRLLVGKTVAWKSPTGKQMRGKITKPHGKNGAVRAHFKKAGLPGQALGDKITIIK